MAKIDNSAYEYYLSTYGNTRRDVSRYDSHKKSELRKVYNDIVKSNTESPLYKLSDPEGAKRYAIDIKESAKSIQNVVSSLSDRQGLQSSFQKKVAVASNDNVLAQYIGDGNEDSSVDSFKIQVQSLATPQRNLGNYLESSVQSFAPGTYSFDLNTPKASYEFQYNVNAGDTNLSVQTKLARLINNANLGIRAEIVKGDGITNALQLTSRQTGLYEDEGYLFQINPEPTPESLHAMDLLGIHAVAEEAHNSSFLLNGVPRSSFSNTFTINQTFELTLLTPNEADSFTTVGFKANLDAVADNINSLVSAYNGILDIAANYKNEQSNSKSTVDVGRLYRDMSGIAFSHQDSLASIGLNVDDAGKISIDMEQLEQAIHPENIDSTLNILENLRDVIGQKAEQASINPMNYVQKVVVAYKNPGHNFATPYVSSIYSGMMLDRAI